MSFLSNDGYFVSKVITVPNPGAGALPATWTMFNTSQTPRDAAGYPVTGGWIYEPSDAVVAPACYYNSDYISYNTNSRYLRASASMRVCDNLSPGQARGAALILLVVNTRAAGDGYGITYGFGTDQYAFSEFGATYFLQPPGGSTKTKYALLSNTWYRFGVELLDRTLYGYIDPTGYGTPTDVLGDDDLIFVGSVALSQDSSDNIYVGWAASGSYSSTNCPGCADLKVESLEPMGGGGGGSSDSSGVPAQTTTPPPVMSPGYGGYTEFSGPIGITDWFGPTDYGWESSPLRKLDAENSFAYRRFKNTRAATNTLNNLVLQP